MTVEFLFKSGFINSVVLGAANLQVKPFELIRSSYAPFELSPDHAHATPIFLKGLTRRAYHTLSYSS